jgi:hypothetical protein
MLVDFFDACHASPSGCLLVVLFHRVVVDLILFLLEHNLQHPLAAFVYLIAQYLSTVLAKMAIVDFGDDMWRLLVLL